jgi:methylated-DNA-[protein]-cysteine S-methyltransferase
MPIRFLPAPGATARWRYTTLDSPIGPLLLAGSAEGLGRLSFADGSRAFEPDPAWMHEPGAFCVEREQLHAYFAGELTAFDVDLAPHATPFQRAVLEVLATVPHGETRSYGEVARLIGRPGASRAVGAANGANPIPVILPCHRVVGADGSLTGFGGGLPRKRFLLDLERRQHELFPAS